MWPTPDTAELKIGLVGLGSIGDVHARALHDVPGTVLMAFSGGDADAAANCGWPEAAHVGHGDVAQRDDVDVVVLCSPTSTHAQLAMAAARAGKHVVVEKPIALSVADAVAIAELQRSEGVLIAGVSQRRLEPEYARVKSLLDDGHLGEIRMAATEVHWVRDKAYYDVAAWRRSQAEGGGALMNQGFHNVDLLRWLCGPAESVTAHYATLANDMDAEDTIVSTVRFESGALATISISTATPPGRPATLSLLTSSGAIRLGQGAVEVWDVPDVPAPQAGAAVSGAKDPLAIATVGHVTWWRDFVECLREGRAYDGDAVDAELTIRLLCGIYEAADQQRTIHLEDL